MEEERGNFGEKLDLQREELENGKLERERDLERIQALKTEILEKTEKIQD